MSLRTAVSISRKRIPVSLATRDMTVLSKKSGEEYQKQNYNERMARTGRPVSPHVTIYQFPITALTSITNRVTGVALSIGSLGIASIELVSPGGAAMLMNDIGTSGPIVSTLAKGLVGFPLVYHYLGGVRHLIWDQFPTEYLNNVGVEKASYVLAGSSALLTAGLMLV